MDKKEYDYVIVEFGWNKWVMPYKAAIAIFDAFNKRDIYKYDESYDSTVRENRPYIKVVTPSETPVLRHLNPVMFHAGLANQEAHDKEEAAKRKAEAT